MRPFEDLHRLSNLSLFSVMLWRPAPGLWLASLEAQLRRKLASSETLATGATQAADIHRGRSEALEQH